MKRPNKASRAKAETIQVWTRTQAVEALPYITSVMRSAREHRLEALRNHLTATRLAGKPGRPNRDAIIAREEALSRASAADQRFRDALTELEVLDISCLDPLGGLAQVPFVNDGKL